MTTDMIVEEAVQVTDENLSKKTGDEPEVVETEKKDEKPEEKKSEEKKSEPKKNHQERRWDKVLGEGNRLKSIVARQQEEIEAYRAAMAERGQNPEQPQSLEKPIRSNYADDAGYIDAVIEYKTNQRMNDIEQKMKVQTEQVKEMTVFETRETEFKSITPDYEEVVQGATDVPVSESIIAAIKASPSGPAIRYYLAQNPDIAEELVDLPPVQAVLEIGRLEAKIVAPVKRPAIKPSGAPEPVKPVAGNRGKNTVDRDRLNDDEWRKLRHAERKKNRS